MKILELQSTKVKNFSLYTPQRRVGSRGVAPLILTLSTTWRWVV